MKYYNYPDNKVQLLQTFSHANHVDECIFKNSTCALCCDNSGYIIEYDLNNPVSMLPPTEFNKTTYLNKLDSCMQTKDKKYIIAGGENNLYILDAEYGTLQHSFEYSVNGGMDPTYSINYQIAEVRPNILVTSDYTTASIHDIRDINNILAMFM